MRLAGQATGFEAGWSCGWVCGCSFPPYYLGWSSWCYHGGEWYQRSGRTGSTHGDSRRGGKRPGRGRFFVFFLGRHRRMGQPCSRGQATARWAEVCTVLHAFPPSCSPSPAPSPPLLGHVRQRSRAGLPHLPRTKRDAGGADGDGPPHGGPMTSVTGAPRRQTGVGGGYRAVWLHASHHGVQGGLPWLPSCWVAVRALPSSDAVGISRDDWRQPPRRGTLSPAPPLRLWPEVDATAHLWLRTRARGAAAQGRSKNKRLGNKKIARAPFPPTLARRVRGHRRCHRPWRSPAGRL